MKIDHKESYKEFGEQFITDSNIDGYWGSKEMLQDIVYPFTLTSIKNKVIMEVGVGSGRILNNLVKFLPKKAIAVEPSQAINIAKKNNSLSKVKIEFLNIKAENLKIKKKVDYVFSLGVIHHIPNHKKACIKVYDSIKPKGKFIIWVYGHEGNELYLLIFNNIRRVTRILPDSVLRMFCALLNLICYAYIFLCKFIRLPMQKYMLEVFGKCSFEKRNYIIFDQLNPSFSKYFKKQELIDLLKESGFKNISITHRHGYSWLAIAQK